MTESLEYTCDYRKVEDLKIHDVATIMPKMDDELFGELKQDVGTFGVKTPILLLKGTNLIIDGRHRWWAAQERMIDVVPVVEVAPEAEGLDFFIMSLESLRKKTTKGQIAMIASAILAKLKRDGVAKRSENLKIGANPRKGTGALSGNTLNETNNSEKNFDEFEEVLPTVTKEDVVKDLDISERTMKDANVVIEKGTLEDKQEVTAGKVSVKAKAKEVRTRAKTGFNKQTGDSIEWAKWSWNPITGCEHTCKYCYAREIAERFRGAAFPNGFDHTFYPTRLEAPSHTKPPSEGSFADFNVFMGSMTDFWGKWQKREEQQQVIDAINAGSPKWRYLSLTKDIWNLLPSKIDLPENFWIGATVDNKKILVDTMDELNKIKEKFPNNMTFISFEPMFTNMLPTLDGYEGNYPDWLIIGGASSTSKTPKFEIDFDQVAEFRSFCKEKGIALYMKSNLIKRVKEFPEEEL